MTRSTLRDGLCLCGARVALHFDDRNRKRDCAYAQRGVLVAQRVSERAQDADPRPKNPVSVGYVVHRIEDGRRKVGLS